MALIPSEEELRKLVLHYKTDRDDLRERLERAERERDYYQNQWHYAEELKRQMTSAASSGAAVATTAIERLQLWEPVVDAGVEWHDARDEIRRRTANGSASYEQLSVLKEKAYAARARLVGAIAVESYRRRNVS